jgi:hypothetical protein
MSEITEFNAETQEEIIRELTADEQSAIELIKAEAKLIAGS